MHNYNQLKHDKLADLVYQKQGFKNIMIIHIGYGYASL